MPFLTSDGGLVCSSMGVFKGRTQLTMRMEIPHLKITKCCRQCELVPIHSGCVSVFADTAEEGLERVLEIWWDDSAGKGFCCQV